MTVSCTHYTEGEGALVDTAVMPTVAELHTEHPVAVYVHVRTWRYWVSLSTVCEVFQPLKFGHILYNKKL